MPRGGHRGGIFPVTGLPWGPNGRYLKRGLYHHKREDIFTPRWGYRFEKSNSSPYPDGSAKSWDMDAKKAWPVTGHRQHNSLYARNEARYLMAASRCTDAARKEYILNMLEDGNGRTFSGIGLPYVSFNSCDPAGMALPENFEEDFDSNSAISPSLVDIAREVDAEEAAERKIAEVSVLRASQTFRRGRISRLWNLVCESSIWKWPSSSSGATSSSPHGPFPYVDETASLVRDLSLAEILYSRSNHRLKCRRHPFWTNLRFVKGQSKIPYLHRRKLARQGIRSKEVGSWGSG